MAGGFGDGRRCAGAHAAGSENETIFAFNAVRDIIKEIATNVDVTVGGHTSLAQVKDTTITDGLIRMMY